MLSKFTKRMLLVATFLTISLLFGIVVGQVKEKKKITKSMDIFSEALYYMKTRYVEEINDKKLFNGAIQSLAENLDPESFYLNSEEFTQFKDQNYKIPRSLLGMNLIKLNQYVRVISVEPDGPADKAKIKPGDFITHVNGITAFDLSLFKLYMLMSGKPGETIELEVLDNFSGEEKKHKLTKANIKTAIPSQAVFKNKIDYIHLYHFHKEDTQHLLKYIEEAQNEILLVDLRNNYAGSREALQSVLDEFIDEGILFTSITRKRSKLEVKATKKKRELSKRLVLLTDTTTTHFSEIFTAVMQDKDLAEVTGLPTRGLIGDRQTLRVGEDTALYISTTVYKPSGDIDIYMKGIKPDIELKVEADFKSEKFIQASDDGKISIKDDPLLQLTIDELLNSES